MKLPKTLTRVTGFSKALALLLILAFFTTAFYMGMMFQKQYTSILATITPTPTPLPTQQVACSVDSDCVLAPAEIKNASACCPNTKCLRLSGNDIVAVNSAWLASERKFVCGVKILCPMIAVMCTREITEENSHYTAKCVSHVCQKVVN